MRDYAKVSPMFWTGRTGKAMKAAGPEAVIVAMYLMTSPHANMIGVYHCPVVYIAHDTGLGIEGASKGLRSAIEADFCTYEADTDYVFVHEFAAYQIGDELKPDDKRCAGVKNELAKIPKGQCWQSFRARYAVPFNLPTDALEAKPLASPLQAPTKPEAGAEERTEAGEERKEVAPAPEKPAEPEKALGIEFLIAQGVELKHGTDWLKARKAKRAPLTQTAWDDLVTEAAKAGIGPPEAVRTAAANSWQGFKASWLDKLRNNGPGKAGTHAGFASKNYREGVEADGSFT